MWINGSVTPTSYIPSQVGYGPHSMVGGRTRQPPTWKYVVYPCEPEQGKNDDLLMNESRLNIGSSGLADL
jgi:hypothetical protein